MYKLFDLNWFFEEIYLIIIDKKNLSRGYFLKLFCYLIIQVSF